VAQALVDQCDEPKLDPLPNLEASTSVAHGVTV